MKNIQKKTVAKTKQDNYYQSQYYKKMLDRKDYSNWIKEKITQQSNLNLKLINSNLNENQKTKEEEIILLINIISYQSKQKN